MTRKTKNNRRYRKKTAKKSIKKIDILRKKFNSPCFGAMHQYIKEISSDKYNFSVHEAGGGGDCLFYSISAGIDVARSIPKMNESRNLDAKKLRGIVGNSILEWDSDKFNEYIEISRLTKNFGEWDDRWNPNYVQNKLQLSTIFKMMGNIHYGTDFDISIISNKLNIGIILFQGNINFGRIYCIPSDNEKPKDYYIFLYNNGGHYQLAGIKKKKQKYYQCVLLLKDIPEFIRKEYKKVCNSELL